MPIGHLSIRINTRRRDHHLWLNNGGVYWVHYTLHFDNRNGGGFVPGGGRRPAAEWVY
jgi:hypothetical protein